jgi:OTT_1508-like deaminase
MKPTTTIVGLHDDRMGGDYLDTLLISFQELYPLVHPEVQIMSYLVKADPLGKSFGYLDSSKYACFMCNVFCKSLGVETRGCSYDQYSASGRCHRLDNSIPPKLPSS